MNEGVIKDNLLSHKNIKFLIANLSNRLLSTAQVNLNMKLFSLTYLAAILVSSSALLAVSAGY